MQPDIDSFVAIVEDTLPCLFTEIAPRRRRAFLEGSDTRIDLDEEAARLDVSTPVAGAHDGLPAEALLDLLAFNFPNDLTRGSFLAGGQGAGARGAGHLALTTSVPLAGTSADEACGAILDQVAAALALGERILGLRGSTFNHGVSNDGA